MMRELRAACGFRRSVVNMMRHDVTPSRRGQSVRKSRAWFNPPESFRARAGIVICLSGATLLWGGCAAPQRMVLQYGVGQIDEPDRAAVFSAAQRALIDLGYRLDRTDLAAGVITTQPTAAEVGRSRGLRSLRIGSPGRVRQLAEVRLAPTATGHAVYCRVATQLQANEAYSMFRREAASSDVPNETAIERDAALTTEQNTVWQTIRRDKTAERRILDAIARHTSQSRP